MISTLSLGSGPGGVQSIQVTLFEYLSEKGNTCKLFDTKDGWVYNELLRKKVDFVFIEIDSKHSKLDYSSYLVDDDLLILFNGNFFENILLFGYSKCKILFWEVYYPWLERFIYNKYYPFKLSAKIMERKIISNLYMNDAIYFIDYMGKTFVENFLKVKIPNKQYLLIPINIPPKQTIPKLNSKPVITYIGRAVDWKINPLIKVLHDILCTNNIFVLINIVTDNALYFKQKIEEKLPEIQRLKINYFENLSDDGLNELFRITNLNIGMGTAALDGAKFGIPTILIDASTNSFPEDYNYRWIFETKEPILGKMITYNSLDYGGNMTINDVFTTLRKDYYKISNLCYDYVLSNYNIESTVKKINKYYLSANLTISSFNNFFIIKYYRILRNLNII